MGVRDDDAHAYYSWAVEKWASERPNPPGGYDFQLPDNRRPTRRRKRGKGKPVPKCVDKFYDDYGIKEVVKMVKKYVGNWSEESFQKHIDNYIAKVKPRKIIHLQPEDEEGHMFGPQFREE